MQFHNFVHHISLPLPYSLLNYQHMKIDRTSAFIAHFKIVVQIILYLVPFTS